MHPEPQNFTVNWTALHAELWHQVLGKYVGQPAVNALELGTYEGRSAVWFTTEILTGPCSQLTCVDPWVSERLASVAEAEAKFDVNTRRYGQRICKVKSPSVPFLLQAAATGARFDFIYVDGDHRAYACLTDIVLAWQLMYPGGVLIIDDTDELFSENFRSTGYPPPRVAANAFLAAFANTYKLLHNAEQVVVEKLFVPFTTFAARP